MGMVVAYVSEHDEGQTLLLQPPVVIGHHLVRGSIGNRHVCTHLVDLRHLPLEGCHVLEDRLGDGVTELTHTVGVLLLMAAP